MTTISIRVDDEQYKHLQKMSHHLSIEKDKNFTLSDLVREALEKTYPVSNNKKVQLNNDK